MSEVLRVVAFLEAATVTGPAKNLLRFCQRVRAGQGRERVEITLATFVRDGGRNAFLEAAGAAGVPVDTVEEKGRFDVGVIEKMRAVLRKRGAHILQTHAVKSAFLARAGGLVRQARWLAFHHGYTAEDLKVNLYNQLNRWSLRGAGRVVTVCQPFADALVQTGLKRSSIDVLPNAIEGFEAPSLELVSEMRQRWGLKEEEQILLTVGRLSREKGQIHLIRSLEKLRQMDNTLAYRALLVGEGPERKRLEDAVRVAELGGRLVFTGQQKDLRPYFACADLFVLPSLTEGSPNVVLEAMAAGVPIVATAVGGVPETVGTEDGVALLSAATDAQGMAENLLQLMRDRQLRMAMGSRGRTRSLKFTPEEYEKRLRGIYARLMAS